MDTKYTAEEIGEILTQATVEYTNIYFDANKTKLLNKQLWAALHIGFFAGLKACGYEEEVIDKGLANAQANLAKVYTQNEKN